MNIYYAQVQRGQCHSCRQTQSSVCLFSVGEYISGKYRRHVLTCSATHCLYEYAKGLTARGLAAKVEARPSQPTLADFASTLTRALRAEAGRRQKKKKNKTPLPLSRGLPDAALRGIL